MRENSGERIDTTLGDLISAVSDAAFDFCNDKQVTYLLAGIALEEILQNAPCESDELAASPGRQLLRNMRLH
jgi:hypothetical protein